MKPVLYSVEIYIASNGKSPVKEWLDRLDCSFSGRVNDRIKRIKFGNFGDYKNLGDGLYELRLKFGSGFRIYYTFKKKRVILLLNSGDKSSQNKDIKLSRKFLQEVNNA